MKNIVKIVLDPFCFRQFEKFQQGGTSSSVVIKFDPVEFTDRINEIYINGKDNLKDGYAPFCKHLFVENFTSVPASTVRINDENKHLVT
jgi:hypothetical protein